MIGINSHHNNRRQSCVFKHFFLEINASLARIDNRCTDRDLPRGKRITRLQGGYLTNDSPGLTIVYAWRSIYTRRVVLRNNFTAPESLATRLCCLLFNEHTPEPATTLLFAIIYRILIHIDVHCFVAFPTLWFKSVVILLIMLWHFV